MSHESALALATGTSTPTQEAISQTPISQESLQSAPFTHLAKKEADLVRARQEFKRDQEIWNQEKTRLQEAKKQYDEYNEAKKTDPLSALKKLGFSETDIFNYLANNQPPELTSEQKAAQAAESAADARIKAFEEAQTKKEKDAQIAQDKSLIQGFRQELNQVIA